ncbi:unnamed protein product, partial [Darwinula stevensoni]
MSADKNYSVRKVTRLCNMERQPGLEEEWVEDKELRICKRRERVETRIQELRAPPKPKTPTPPPEVSHTEAQLQQSAEGIRSVLANSSAFVTNVHLAAISREKERRRQHEEEEATLEKSLDEVHRDWKKRLEEIHSRWESAERMSSAEELRLLLASQQAATEELLSERKQQLEHMHQKMEEDLEAYETSVGKDTEVFALLTARMRKQYGLLLTRYRSEALKIQEAIRKDQEEMGAKQEEEFRQEFHRVQQKEERNLEKRLELDENRFRAFCLGREEREEATRKAKDDLDRQIHEMRERVEERKAASVLYAEKLDYALHVLKRREAEAKLLKADLKRTNN